MQGSIFGLRECTHYVTALCLFVDWAMYKCKFGISTLPPKRTLFYGITDFFYHYACYMYTPHALPKTTIRLQRDRNDVVQLITDWKETSRPVFKSYLFESGISALHQCPLLGIPTTPQLLIVFLFEAFSSLLSSPKSKQVGMKTDEKVCEWWISFWNICHKATCLSLSLALLFFDDQKLFQVMK